ncbi:MAG: IS1380 family transposase [Candidatus Poribacteria bacterium]
MGADLLRGMKLGRTSEFLTSFSGLTLIAKFADALELPQQLNTSLSRLKRRCRGYTPSDVVLSLSLLHIAGGSCLDDVKLLNADPYARRLVGDAGVPSANTLGVYLRRFTHRDIAALAHTVWELGRRSLDEWSREDTSDRVVIDFDGSLIQANKRAAKKTYKGFRGYHPLLAMIDGADIVLAGLFRHGNAAPSVNAVSFLRRCLDALPQSVAQRTVFVRSDSAWYQRKVLDVCEARGVRFTISAGMDQSVLRACRGISTWSRLISRDPDEDRFEEVGETVHAIGRSFHSPAYRLVACRRRRVQGDLWDGEYEYRAFITNVPEQEMPPAELIFFHRRRGDCENILKELKGGFGLDTVPCGTLLANAAYFQTILLSYNLIQFLKRSALPDAWRCLTMKTLRFRLVFVAGRLVRHARSWTLKLPRSYPFHEVFSHAFWEIGQLRV